MNYLLDSCSLLWLTDNPRRLSEPARRAISHPAAAVHVSAASAWELGIKVARRKLTLPRPVSEWFTEVCRRYALREIPVSGLLAAKSTELPRLHADPFDRLLAASALELGLTVLTPDPHFSKYPNLKTLW
jgi:PIN domain nuclease of toxin-antitoxin system